MISARLSFGSTRARAQSELRRAYPRCFRTILLVGPVTRSLRRATTCRRVTLACMVLRSRPGAHRGRAGSIARQANGQSFESDERADVLDRVKRTRAQETRAGYDA